MEIRFFRLEDTDSVSELLHEMSRHYNGDNASTLDVVRRNLIDNILGPDSDVRIVVAVIGARVVGIAMISVLYPAQKERAQLFMKELYVGADYRSQGIGKHFMAWIAEYAIAKNCVRFDWTVDVANVKALAFYRSLGVRPTADKLYFRCAGDELRQMAGQKQAPVNPK
jgi:GNAT superfamily N-acetyltransferase